MFMVMASLSGRKQQKELEKKWKKQGKGREVDMCKAIDDMLDDSRNEGLRIGREEGREEGREKGIIEGEERISKLFFCLISDNRLEDLKRAAQDKEFQNMLMKTYAI